MFKKRYSRPGSAPATLSSPTGASKDVVIRMMEYDQHGCAEKTAQSVSELPDLDAIHDGKIRWIELNGLGDVDALKALGEKYHLHPLALEDVLNVGQRPKIEPYSGHLFIVVQMVYRDEEEFLCGSR